MKLFLTDTIDRIFSDKYVHANINVVQLVMYRLAFPFAALFNRIGLSPNQITTLSLLSSVFAFVALVMDDDWGYFSLCWGLSILFDFSDGTVARMSNRVSKQAFRYDHMSDLFKLSLVMLGVGIRYGGDDIWAVTTSAVFLLMYYSLLNHDLIMIERLLEKQSSAQHEKVVAGNIEPTETVATPRLRERFAIIRWLIRFETLHRVFMLVWPPVSSLNGHTLLLFFVFPHGPEIALAGLLYLAVITTLGIRARITRLLSLPKP